MALVRFLRRELAGGDADGAPGWLFAGGPCGLDGVARIVPTLPVGPDGAIGVP